MLAEMTSEITEKPPLSPYAVQLLFLYSHYYYFHENYVHQIPTISESTCPSSLPYLSISSNVFNSCNIPGRWGKCIICHLERKP